MPVEQARHHQPHGVHGGLGAEAPGAPGEELVALVQPHLAGRGDPRVKIERHVQFFHFRPEWLALRLVHVLDGVGVPNVGEAVHEDAHKAQLFDTALGFRRSSFGVLHRNAAHRTKPSGVWAGCVFRVDLVVDFSRGVDCGGGVEDTLDPGHCERDNCQRYPSLVHRFHPGFNVRKPVLDIRHKVCVDIR